MPWLFSFRNKALNEVKAKFAFKSLWERSTSKLAKTSSGSKFKQTGAASANGTLVTITAWIKGGDTVGFKKGSFYFVVGSSGEEFQLSSEEGGAAITATESIEFEYGTVAEVPYGTGGRSSTSYSTGPASGQIEDTASHSFKPKELSTINYVGDNEKEKASEETGGTATQNKPALTLSAVSQEKFNAEGGTYTVTNSAQNLNAAE